jgi:outer membrane immunogenic protein
MRTQDDGFLGGPLVSTTGPFSGHGGEVGGTLGWNWQVPGGPWLLGVEGDWSWANIDVNDGACTPACDTKLDWLSTVRGRGGYVFTGRFLAFATGGLALTSAHITQPSNFDFRETEVGWTVGGGLEAMTIPHWSVKAEYLYLDFRHGEQNPITFVVGGLTREAFIRTQVLHTGINDHF